VKSEVPSSVTGPCFLPPVALPQRYLPAHVQYASASHQSTFATGRFAPPSIVAVSKLVFHAHFGGCDFGSTFASRKVWYCAFVTSVVSMQNVLP